VNPAIGQRVPRRPPRRLQRTTRENCSLRSWLSQPFLALEHSVPINKRQNVFFGPTRPARRLLFVQNEAGEARQQFSALAEFGKDDLAALDRERARTISVIRRLLLPHAEVDADILGHDRRLLHAPRSAWEDQYWAAPYPANTDCRQLSGDQGCARGRWQAFSISANQRRLRLPNPGIFRGPVIPPCAHIREQLAEPASYPHQRRRLSQLGAHNTQRAS
jgi:hypothetical protein